MPIRQSERMQPESLLTIAAAAGRLGCSDMHVYRLVSSGELRAVDIAQPGARRSKTRIRSDDLAAYIEANTRSVTRRPSPAAQGQAAVG